MRPRVALTVSGSGSAVAAAARGRYVEALRNAGAEVIVVAPGETLPRDFDALCLSGGGDIDPSRYGQPNAGSVDIDPRRDELELAAAERALDGDLPVLGVCRGFQVLNVAFGGSLVQHHHGHAPGYPPPGKPSGPDEPVITHEIVPVAGSLLAAASGEAAHTVNSRHHQAVTDATLAAGLRASARVGDVIEAIESPAHRWVLGVQWHPERTSEVDPRAVDVFAALVRAASRARVA